MKWSRRLRWKLFISHLAIIVVALVVLVVSANVLAGTKLSAPLPLTLEASVAETGRIAQPGPLSGPLLAQFRLVVAQALLIAGFAALAAAVVVSMFISRRIVEPLMELSAVSRNLALGYYHERTSLSSDDELAALSQSVNALAEALEQTERRRLHLIADVAHELRTPLATIEGYMEGLIDGVIPADPQTYTLVLRESVRLQRLIEDLQLLSRAEAGQLSIRPVPTSLGVLIDGLVAQFQAQFAADDIVLATMIAPDLPQVLADPDRFNQIMVNLLTNAYRYTPEAGTVMILAEPYGDAVRIGVRDTGVGLAPAHLTQIFERFYRVDKSRARSSGGSGIGLTIVRHLVYGQGGAVWAESEGIGKGSVFYFTLPIVEDGA